MVTLNATTSPANALQTVNNLTVTYGIPLFSVSVLVLLWLIVYNKTKNIEGAKGAVAASSFFTSVIAMAFAYVGLLPDEYFVVFLAVSVLSLVPLTYK